MKIVVFKTINPGVWSATATWKEGSVTMLVNGEGRTEQEARSQLQLRLAPYNKKAKDGDDRTIRPSTD